MPPLVDFDFFKILELLSEVVLLIIVHNIFKAQVPQVLIRTIGTLT